MVSLKAWVRFSIIATVALFLIVSTPCTNVTDRQTDAAQRHSWPRLCTAPLRQKLTDTRHYSTLTMSVTVQDRHIFRPTKNNYLQTPLAGVILNDLERPWMSCKIFNDTKHRASSLQQLSFLYYITRLCRRAFYFEKLDLQFMEKIT